ncbi:MAG: DUF111 family protein [Lachnospiraceae bacterium]|nr:DUF111 family protein [Candidatus Equihabitans merdae]
MDKIVELRCNLDDMTAEAMGFALERIYEAGAVEAFTMSVMTKKNRMGMLLTVLVKPDKEEEVVKTIFRYTSTIGIRRLVEDRYVLERHEEVKETPDGPVRIKVSEGYGICRRKPEYEDLKAIALKTGKSIDQVRTELG